jgi:hypothetical protein
LKVSTVSSFVDPRSRPKPSAERVPARTTTDEAELRELLALCKCGDLYEVERWIQAGRPLHLSHDAAKGRRASASALRVALEAQNASLVFLLLCNGYDPDLEEPSPLTLCLEGRKWDLMDLLLEWGADPKLVDPYEVFRTYRTDLMERFRDLGTDMAKDRDLAWVLAEATSNKPAFGYAKRHRLEDPGIQRHLDAALAHHAGEGNEKGVALCLWAGADPHAKVHLLRHPPVDAEEEDDEPHWNAVWEAGVRGHADILEQLGPDPDLDRFDDLYGWTESRAVIDVLSRSRLPSEMGPILAEHISPWRVSRDGWFILCTVTYLFEIGARWTESDPGLIADIRRSALRLNDRNFEKLIRLLTTADYCSPAVLSELARTSAFRRRLREVGFLPTKKRDRPSAAPSQYAYRKILSKLGIELPKPAPEDRPLRPVVWIGRRRTGTQERRLTRQEIFDRVWTTPIVQLAPEWGLSDQGLHKACRRLQIPRPPRGWWAKAQAGRRVRRPKLPKLPEGQGEEIIVWERVP